MASPSRPATQAQTWMKSFEADQPDDPMEHLMSSIGPGDPSYQDESYEIWVFSDGSAVLVNTGTMGDSWEPIEVYPDLASAKEVVEAESPWGNEEED